MRDISEVKCLHCSKNIPQNRWLRKDRGRWGRPGKELWPNLAAGCAIFIAEVEGGLRPTGRPDGGRCSVWRLWKHSGCFNPGSGHFVPN